MTPLQKFLLALAAATPLALPSLASAQVSIGVSVTLAPPVLPVYVQPAPPEIGYIWTPGYWAYGSYGYYWVPGTWVLPPAVGLLWTPGYWGWTNGRYFWHGGYWGPQVGYYGGIDYGFGYSGHGYYGGAWNHGVFTYNRAVNNVQGISSGRVYDRAVPGGGRGSRVSFNGGNGGVTARPTPQEDAAARERHVPRTAQQTQHERAAGSNSTLRATVNHGVPPVAATRRPGTMTGPGTVGGRGPATAGPRPGEARPGEARPGEARPGMERPGATPPGMARPGEARPGMERPGFARPGAPAAARPEAPHPMEARPAGPRPGEGRPMEARPAAPRPQVMHAAPQRAAPQAQRPQAQRPQAPHPQAPHPQAAHPQAQHPAPQGHPGGGDEDKHH